VPFSHRQRITLVLPQRLAERRFPRHLISLTATLASDGRCRSNRRIPALQMPVMGQDWTVTWLDNIDDRERTTVAECLRAATDGPFFPDWEFQTLFGLERDEVRDVLARWPDPADPEEQWQAINGAMNLLLGYPHGKDQIWADYISVDRESLDAIYWHLSELTGANDRRRARIADTLAGLARVPDDQVPVKKSLMRDVSRAAARYGVAVPERVRRVLADDQ
jgi:hypothetical protein